MTLEIFGWMALGASAFILGYAASAFVHSILRRRQRKFEKFLDDIRAQGEELIRQQGFSQERKHVSELTFRDKTGTLCTVEIIIDPDLPNVLPESDELTKMVKEGNLGTMQDLIKGNHMGAMDDVEKFVFSAKTVDHMREQGIEPDEMVRRMLKASGRIA